MDTTANPIESPASDAGSEAPTAQAGEGRPGGQFWDDRYAEGKGVCAEQTAKGDPIDYTQHPLLYRHACAEPLTGKPDKWIIDDIAEHFFSPPVERGLAIGSGMAFVEETLVRNGHVRHFTAYEASPVAVEAGRKRIREAGLDDRIDLRCGDVLKEDLPSDHFDLVFVQAAIHHFFEIEPMFDLMRRVLRRSGLLVYDEYVGPDHHIYGPEVIAVLNRINDCLAPEYRFDVLNKARRDAIHTPSLAWMLDNDPSEGVHASEILPLTYQYFDVLQRRDYGGSLMRPFWVGVLPNFDFDRPADATIGRLIVLIERLMTERSVLPHYHTSVVARRRDVVRPPLTKEQRRGINYSDWRLVD